VAEEEAEAEEAEGGGGGRWGREEVEVRNWSFRPVDPGPAGPAGPEGPLPLIWIRRNIPLTGTGNRTTFAG
jgi:hypothetical protein